VGMVAAGPDPSGISRPLPARSHLPAFSLSRLRSLRLCFSASLRCVPGRKPKLHHFYTTFPVPAGEPSVPTGNPPMTNHNSQITIRCSRISAVNPCQSAHSNPPASGSNATEFRSLKFPRVLASSRLASHVPTKMSAFRRANRSPLGPRHGACSRCPRV
jgi:hypothetical protein